jgi:hypothetical protein
MKKTSKDFDFSHFLLGYENKIGRKLTEIEVTKARKIYSDIIAEDAKKANNLFMTNERDTTDDTLSKKFSQYENYILANAEQLMESHKKLQENSTIEVKKGNRVNLKFPGNIHIIAVDRSGEVIEINNKEDVEYNMMAYRFDTIKDQAKDVITQEIRRDMEFE